MAAQTESAERMKRPKTAVEVAKSATLEDPAKALLRPDFSPKQYIDALTEQGYYADAVRFLPHVLQRREAVWWAIQCVKQVPAALEEQPHVQTLSTAESWVTNTAEETRRKAFDCAEEIGFGTPAGCAALSAFWADGSITPPDVQAVPPPPQLSASAAANACILAAVIAEPDLADEKLKKFISTGLEVAEGTNRWKEARTTPPISNTGASASHSPSPKPVQPPQQPKKGWY